jgi:phosphoglycolate phosphatase-like HAD superfamily hydrolase
LGDSSIRRNLTALLLACAFAFLAAGARADPLPSWNEGAAKQRILDFVGAVTDPSGDRYVAPEARIAVFDNDGTLWSEKPYYFQLAFVLDRVRALAPAHPEWREKEPFRAVIEGDREALSQLGTHDLLALVAATHSGQTDAEFAAAAQQWLASARHPTRDVPFTELVFQPMLELLAFLREEGFQTWIVSGGGIDFLRVFAEDVYGIPPEQVIGSGVQKAFREDAGTGGAFVRLPELLAPLNDEEGKPVWIRRHIGRRPILAFGNSDGDLAMLTHATGGDGPSLGLLLHHDDAEREWAYDRASSVGGLDRGLDQAGRRGWVLVSMKDDFGRVYPAR